MIKRISAVHGGLLLASLLAACGAAIGCGSASPPASPTAPSLPPLSNPPPTILSVSRSIGSTGGGASLVIIGDGLLPGIHVAFGSMAVATHFSPGADRIHVTTRSHPPGSVDVVVTNVDGQKAVAMGAYTFAAPESFDVNGNWRGASFEGDYDYPFSFTVMNNAIVSVTCSTSGLVTPSPPVPIIKGEFFFDGKDGLSISGRILAPHEASGVVNIGPAGSVRSPCVGAEWHANKEDRKSVV